MRTHEATETIHAEPDRVWQTLTDTAAYGDWDSGIDRAEGSIAPGGRLTLHSQGRTLHLKVAELEPERRMTWSARLPLGLSTATRTFSLTPARGGGTHLHVHDEYGGPIRRTLPPFERFVDGLKARLER